MQIRFADSRPTGDYALVLPVAGKDRSSLGSLGAAQQGVSSALDRQRFEGDASSAAEHFIDDNGSVRRVLAVGTGGASSPREAAEKLGGTAVSRLLTSGEKKAVIDVSGLGYDADAAGRVGARCRASLLALRSLPDQAQGQAEADTWRDHHCRRRQGRGGPLRQALGAGLRRRVADPRARHRAGQHHLSGKLRRARAKSLEGSGVEVEVLDRKAMEKLGMGALLGVAQGSVRDARLLILRWNGGGKDGQPVAFVGKGVTFDTGGISIKPAAGMEAMKWDMGGAGAVAGAMKAIALRKAKANIVGICGLVENMPDGNAQRPGDVVTTMSGQTVEVINTDAEGRLVLADAITYVQRTYKPSTIIDLATLTGAILISLGHEWAGVFSNDDKLATELQRVGEESGDKLWRMPLAEFFDRLIDSPIADMKNVGPREGGSITAAQFIQRFVENGVKWAHIDMAGKAWADKPSATYDKGATGFGVRLLDEYVAC